LSDYIHNHLQVELVRVDGKTDVTLKANSECKLVLRGTLEKLRFKAHGNLGLHGEMNSNRILEKDEIRGAC
jgi:hypothetical protein